MSLKRDGAIHPSATLTPYDQRERRSERARTRDLLGRGRLGSVADGYLGGPGPAPRLRHAHAGGREAGRAPRRTRAWVGVSDAPQDQGPPVPAAAADAPPERPAARRVRRAGGRARRPSR